MKKLMVMAVFALALLGAAEPPTAEPERPSGWKTVHFSYENPCHIERFNFFCCSIKKCVIVPKEKNARIYYYYNRRNEIIGWRKVTGEDVDDNSSTIVALGCNCTECQRQKILIHYWDNRWRTRMIPPRRRK